MGSPDRARVKPVPRILCAIGLHLWRYPTEDMRWLIGVRWCQRCGKEERL